MTIKRALIDGFETGMTHAADLCGILAIQHDRRKVRFFSTLKLANALDHGAFAGMVGQITVGQITVGQTQLDLAILDKFG